MIAREIKPDIRAIVAIDWDRKIFDELIPLPEGTTYNSYLVKGSEKTAYIDTVNPPMKDELLDVLKKSGISKLDYVIANHGEQDHSGSIPAVLEMFPEAKVVTNEKCKGTVSDALPVPEDKFIVVKDGDTLSLGNKTLKFFITPWVHWPDTMMTYIPEDKIIFSCDFLGSHLATSDLFATDEASVYTAAKRYYAEIMMPFRTFVQKYLALLDTLDIEMIAPSHGPIYPKPSFILDLYKTWASAPAKKEVIIPYVTMFGNTKKMVNYLVDRLMEKGMTVKQQFMVGADTGKLANSLVEASTVVFASSALLGGPNPSIVGAAYLMNALKPKTKFAAVIGSYGWGANLSDRVTALLPNLKSHLHFFDPVLVKGLPQQSDYEKLDRLAEEIYKANNEA